jgi:hypothetical protein
MKKPRVKNLVLLSLKIIIIAYQFKHTVLANKKKPTSYDAHFPEKLTIFFNLIPTTLEKSFHLKSSLSTVSTKAALATPPVTMRLLVDSSQAQRISRL